MLDTLWLQHFLNVLLHAIIPVVCRCGRPNLLIQKVLCLNDVVDVRRGVKKHAKLQCLILQMFLMKKKKEKNKTNCFQYGVVYLQIKSCILQFNWCWQRWPLICKKISAFIPILILGEAMLLLVFQHENFMNSVVVCIYVMCVCVYDCMLWIYLWRSNGEV